MQKYSKIILGKVILCRIWAYQGITNKNIQKHSIFSALTKVIKNHFRFIYAVMAALFFDAANPSAFLLINPLRFLLILSLVITTFDG